MGVTEQQIIDTYQDCMSIKATARRLSISESTVRRHLVIAGHYTNDRKEEIDQLMGEGFSVPEIAAKLHVVKNTVRTYLPYTKGSYIGPEKSENAMRIRKCREKKRIAKEL